MDFFQSLNFSSTNEDGDTENAALADCERILCVTGSGTRPLDLLMTDAREIIALDVNPAQNALLALKIAAISKLDRSRCLAFLGISPSLSRREDYTDLRQDLPAFARAFWDAQPRLIEQGIWSAGKWERLMRWNARALALFRGRAVDSLMNARTIDEQAAIWRRSFVGGPMRNAVEAFARDLIWRLFMREPSSAFLPSARQVTERLARDFERASRSFLFRDSDLATLVFRGALTADGALPAHLRVENHARIRERVGRIQILTRGIADLSVADTGPCDGFSLSDFGSYCGAADYAACWRGVMAISAPGARFCERIFLNEMPPPSPDIRIDDAASERLNRSDRSIIYRTRAGVIGGNG